VARKKSETDRTVKGAPEDALRPGAEHSAAIRRPRVILADDHMLVLDGLRKLLDSECEVVGAVQDGRALLAAAEKLRPDVILLDIAMPLLNGVEAARHLRRTVPDAKLVFVTMHADGAYVSGALRAGASGYVLKQSAASELLTAIREVVKGRTYVAPLARKYLSQPLPPSDLTEREREVLQLVAEGRTIKEIGTLLNISAKTATFHKSNIMRKLGIRGTAKLTKYALAHGIVA
jgi:DNA-binding NarL/FixJ family response regulator